MDDAVGWLVALSFAFFTFRYFFGSSSSGSGSTSRRYNVPQSSITTVSSMFPHIPVASIKYELERTRNNVEATVERCLRDGTLPEPPASFFISEQAAAAAASNTASGSTSGPPSTPARPNPSRPGANVSTPASSSSSAITPNTTSPSLIQRLNLQDRLNASGGGSDDGSNLTEFPPGSASKGKGKLAAPAWEGSAEAREKSLRARKEKMVLEARRKLLEKEQAKKASNA